MRETLSPLRSVSLRAANAAKHGTTVEFVARPRVGRHMAVGDPGRSRRLEYTQTTTLHLLWAVSAHLACGGRSQSTSPTHITALLSPGVATHTRQPRTAHRHLAREDLPSPPREVRRSPPASDLQQHHQCRRRHCSSRSPTALELVGKRIDATSESADAGVEGWLEPDQEGDVVARKGVCPVWSALWTS